MCSDSLCDKYQIDYDYVVIDNIYEIDGNVNVSKSTSTQSSVYHHGNLREALIRQAVKAIEKGGVESVSLRALAREIGVSHGAPIRHFPTRSSLLAAIAQHGITKLLESATDNIKNPKLTNVEKLKAMSEGYLAWVADNPIEHMLIRNQDVMRHATEELTQQIDGYARLHEQMVKRAQSEGWRKNEQTRAVFLELTAFTAGLALIASDPIYSTVFKKQPRKNEVASALTDFFASRY